MNQTVEITQRTQDPPTLEIVLSPNVSQIEGVVTTTLLQPVSGAQAVLIPDQNRDRVELYKAATTDQTGHFTIRGIAPGDYKLSAWEHLESYAYFDPDFVRQSESSGKPVRQRILEAVYRSAACPGEPRGSVSSLESFRSD